MGTVWRGMVGENGEKNENSRSCLKITKRGGRSNTLLPRAVKVPRPVRTIARARGWNMQLPLRSRRNIVCSFPISCVVGRSSSHQRPKALSAPCSCSVVLTQSVREAPNHVRQHGVLSHILMRKMQMIKRCMAMLWLGEKYLSNDTRAKEGKTAEIRAQKCGCQARVSRTMLASQEELQRRIIHKCTRWVKCIVLLAKETKIKRWKFGPCAQTIFDISFREERNFSLP